MKSTEYHEGEEAAQRFESGMRKFLNYVPSSKATSATPKPEPQEPQQSSEAE